MQVRSQLTRRNPAKANQADLGQAPHFDLQDNQDKDVLLNA